MKFLGLAEYKQGFPDGTSAPGWMLRFERDGVEVTKRITVSGLARKCAKNKHQLNAEFVRMCQKAAREADRDLAFIKHRDEWRDHCEITSPFFGPMHMSELQKAFES